MTLEAQIKRLLKFVESTHISNELDYKTRQNILGLKNRTIALRAARTAYDQVMDSLCVKGLKDDDGRDPLHLAVFHGMKEFTKDLLEAGISTDSTCEIDAGIYGIVGACLNYANNDYNKYLGILRILFEHDADPDETYDDGENDIPVIEFLESNFPVSYLSLFIEFDVDINQELDDGGYTLLDSCIMIDEPDRVTFLLENGADANAQRENGDRPLTVAMDYDNQAIVKDLLLHKANPNLLVEEGNSVVMYAIEQDKPEMVKICIENSSVDFSIKNENGETARDIALRKNDQDSVTLIDQIIAKNQRSTNAPHYNLRPRNAHTNHSQAHENALHRVRNKQCHK